MIYSDQVVCIIIIDQTVNNKFIGNVVSKPRKKIKEFVAFVTYYYSAPEVVEVEVDKEDFIRRWNEAYEVPNIQD